MQAGLAMHSTTMRPASSARANEMFDPALGTGFDGTLMRDGYACQPCRRFRPTWQTQTSAWRGCAGTRRLNDCRRVDQDRAVPAFV